MWKQLLPYQQDAVLRFLAVRRLCLFFEQRTGKTYVTLGILDQLEPDDVLLVVPLTNIESTWSTKLTEYLPQYTICRTWPEFKKIKGKRILLLHYEAVSAIVAALARRAWGIVIFDESQRLKARASASSRAASKLRHNECKLLLSGTPMDASPIDIWAQMRLIEPQVLSDRWADFSDYFCKTHRFDTASGQSITKTKFRKDRMREFLQLVEPFAIRVTKEMAGITRARQHVVYVRMFGEQADIYREMWKDSVTWIEQHRSMAKMTMTKIIRCHQIAGGFIRTDDGDIRAVGRAKVRKLRWVVNQREFPIVIFCKYREEMRLIEEVMREFSDRGAILSGAVKDRKTKKPRTEMIQALQRGELDWLICQTRTGGVGVDLFTARTGIIYSLPYSFIDHDQVLSRLEALDQEGVADFFLLICRNTVDEDMLEAVSSKRAVTEVVMRHLKRRNL